MADAQDLYYTVKRGDTLKEIADRYNVSVDDLAEWNDIENPDKIDVNQRLVIRNPTTSPAEGSPFPKLPCCVWVGLVLAALAWGYHAFRNFLFRRRAIQKNTGFAVRVLFDDPAIVNSVTDHLSRIQAGDRDSKQFIVDCLRREGAPIGAIRMHTVMAHAVEFRMRVLRHRMTNDVDALRALHQHVAAHRKTRFGVESTISTLRELGYGVSAKDLEVLLVHLGSSTWLNSRIETLRVESTVQNLATDDGATECLLRTSNPEIAAARLAERGYFVDKSLISKVRQAVDTTNRRVELEMNSVELMSGYEFEDWCTGLFQKLGYFAESTAKARDGGIDIRMERGGTGFLVQCKRQEAKIGSPAVQRLGGVRQQPEFRNFELIFVTTATFTAAAKEYCNKVGIRMVDRARLRDLVLMSGIINKQ